MNPRDKLFGLIGLAVDCDNPTLKPDYSLETSTVFKRFAINHNRMTQNFELFSVCCLGDRLFRKLSTLLSWVPDWSQRIEHDTLGAMNRVSHAGGLEI